MMSAIVLRAVVFAIAFYGVSAALTVLFAPGLLMPYRVVLFLKQTWLHTVRWLVRRVLGIGLEIRGRGNLPDGPVILAAKHQSAWDTMGLSLLHPKAAFVLKRELMWIPLWGWYVKRMGMIPIDRAHGVAALRNIAAIARERVAEGRPVLIFPQGTRTAPGAKRPYLPGVAAIYTALGVPVVPVALNSGMFWPRRRFLKWPGTITVEYLEPIAPGLERRKFMRVLEARLEGATERLEAEAAERFPWLPAPSPAAPDRESAGAAAKT